MQKLTAAAMDSAKAKAFFSKWSNERKLEAVELIHNDEPENDKYPDYFVSYEVVFLPSDPNSARVEMWVTDDGYVSIGFETRARVAKRLGVTYHGHPSRFADGHEPSRLTDEAVSAVLDCVASGAIAIRPRVLPIVGLISTRALIAEAKLNQLIDKGYTNKWWLRRTDPDVINSNANLVRFEPWR